eukprot:6932771-Ditylum_brightwellii.AAC.2
MAYNTKSTASGLNIPSSHRTDPLWLRLQTIFNESLRELFIEGTYEKVQMALDDEKEHCTNASRKSTKGIKYTQHVGDNKRGFIQHTAASTF